LRHGLPYGAVMATGGAAQLAGACGVPDAMRPLLWLAVVEAGWIAGRGLVRHRGELRLPLSAWVSIGPPAEHTGVLTVPLGLAVVATGLSVQPGPSEAIGAGFLVLSWLTAVALVARFALSVARRSSASTSSASTSSASTSSASTSSASTSSTVGVDGGWFLAPAAVLGAGIAAGAYAGQAVGLLAEVLRWGALLSAGIGLAGYWAVAASAALTLPRRGLGQGRRVLWWIAAGCGGLAAAAAARALSAGGRPWPAGVVAAGHAAAVATWALAAVLAGPIVVASVSSLVRSRRIVRTAPWPPTFSTAVFALGALAIGKVLKAPTVTSIGTAAAGATLALWAVTAALHTSRLLPGARRRRPAQTTDLDNPMVPPNAQAPDTPTMARVAAPPG
jgi:hypothetical protein